MGDVDWTGTTKYYNDKRALIDSNVSRTDWVGFLDALGWTETIDGNYCGFGGWNNAYIGIYQVGPGLLTDMSFFNGIGKQFLDVTTRSALATNPIAQEIAGIMEFCGFPDIDPIKPFDSIYIATKKQFSNFDKLLGKTFTIQYENTSGIIVGSDTVTFTQAGISAAAHLVGQGTMGKAMAQIYADCFNTEGVQISSTATLSTVGFADGAGRAFSTYMKLMQSYDISPLLSVNGFSDFNTLVQGLMDYRKDKIINYLIANKQEVAMSVSYDNTNYRDTVRAIMVGLDLQTDNLNAVDGRVVLVGAASNKKYTDKADLIFGLGNASNTLDGGTGTDTMIGGAGDDTYKVDDSNDKIVEKDGEGKELVESTATYTLPDNVENLTLMGKENIDGTGNELDNDIKGNTGNNRLEGGKGNDSLYGGGGNNVMDGGADDDILDGSMDDVDILWGDAGKDTLYGGTGDNNNLSGGANDDILYGANGNDFLYGDDDNDLIYGGAGNDFIEGGAGNDTIFGEADSDEIDGGSGDDVLYSGGGNNDTFVDSSGFDTYYIKAQSATITDTGGDGQVFSLGGQLRGGKRLKGKTGVYRDDWGNYYEWQGDGDTLTITCVTGSVIYVNNFSNDNLQIHLEEKEEKKDAYADLVDTATITESPIVLDLDRDGIETTNINNGTFFDHDGNGFAELTGWVSADDGLLVMDRTPHKLIFSLTKVLSPVTLSQQS